MNQDSKENLWLVDHLHKCRCCFERFDHNENQFEITEIIEEQFLELTKIELKQSPNFSNIVCSKCSSELQSISNFRLNLMTKQQKLYESVILSLYKIQDDIKFESVNIKIEAQISDEFESMFHFGTSLEEIKSLEVPIVSKKTEAKSTRKSLRQLRTHETEVETVLQTSVLKKSQIKEKKESETKVMTNMDQQAESTRMCPHCGIFVKPQGFSKHIRRIHLKQKRFFCDMCSYVSFNKYGIKKHIMIHLPKIFREKFACDQCDFVTVSLDSMKSHKKYDHDIDGEKFACQCGKVFTKRCLLYAHKRQIHLNEKKHICTICSKAYSTSNSLKKHFMAKHSGIVRIRDKACEVCGKMFMALKHLRSHMIHHKDPQFICTFDGCTKKCFTQALLERHKKTHIDQRDYACQLCDKKYFMPNHLSRHVKNFHRQLKVSCELPGCSSKFARKETYRNHVLSHHKDLSQEKVQALLKKIRELKQE